MVTRTVEMIEIAATMTATATGAEMIETIAMTIATSAAAMRIRTGAAATMFATVTGAETMTVAMTDAVAMMMTVTVTDAVVMMTVIRKTTVIRTADGGTMTIVTMIAIGEEAVTEIRRRKLKRHPKRRLSLTFLVSMLPLPAQPRKRLQRLQWVGVLSSLRLQLLGSQPSATSQQRLRLPMAGTCSVAQHSSLPRLVPKCNRCLGWAATKQPHKPQHQCLLVAS